MRLNPDPRTAPQRAHCPRSARPPPRPDHEWIAARRRRSGPSGRRKFQCDGGQRERFDRDGPQTPAGGSAKQRKDRRTRPARASRRADRGRRGRTHDSPKPPHRNRRPVSRCGNPEPSATASQRQCRRRRSTLGRVQAACSLGGPGCRRPSRRRRFCAVVGFGGRRPEGHHSQRANVGNGRRSRVRRAENDQYGRPRSRGVGRSSNGSEPSRSARDQARARPTPAGSRDDDARRIRDTKPAGPRRVVSDNIVPNSDIHATAIRKLRPVLSRRSVVQFRQRPPRWADQREPARRDWLVR
jgi:hypothetical protein